MSQAVDSSVRFWNLIAKWYARQAIADPAAYQKKLALTQAFLTPETRALEFGCGTGSTALLHAPRVKSILAVDNSPKMIQIAQNKLRDGAPDNVTFQTATLFDLPQTTYDVVLGLNILHLVPDLDATLRRCYQLLEPGGTFISSTPCVGGENGLMKVLLPLGGKLGLIPKLLIFSAQELEAAFKKAGFEIQQSLRLNKGGQSAFIVAQRP